uniref:Cyclin N-terminal domain-containing protein n=1 Tax=Globodera pallida TaxID=36090 RepID=A0A183C400_GLOPA
MKIGHRTPPRQKRATDPPPQFDSSDLGSPHKVWSLLCEKDEKLRRDPHVFSRQKKINAKMRSMLLDWVMDHLHRETFHLCVDYIDRYIALSDEQLQPQRLQLFGSTALAIASKVEVKCASLYSLRYEYRSQEIYPPKIAEIAEYTDGCCSVSDIRGIEEIMLEKLDWSCYPVTAVHWLALYMQLMSTDEVIPAQRVVISAGKRPSETASANADSEQSPFGYPSLEVSIVSALPNDENNLPDDAKQTQKCFLPSTVPSLAFPLDDEDPSPSSLRRDDHFEVTTTNSVETARVRHISFSCAFPRMQLSHIGSSPRVLLHTAQADISYVGHSSYSSGHIYPDQRCTVPKLMRGEFVRLASILDLAMLDAGCLHFRYSELATAVVLCCYEPENLICQLTGFSPDKIREVRAYIEPFVQVFDRNEPTGTAIPCLPDVPHDDRHNIQTYTHNCLAHLETTQRMRKETEVRRKAVELRVAARVRKRKFGSAMNL